MISSQNSQYKKSYVSWAPIIPLSWKILRVKDFAIFTTGFTPPSDNHEFYGDDYFWANISDLGTDRLSETSQCLSKKAINEYKPESSKKGDLLFSFKLSVGQVSIVENEMYTNEAIVTFKKIPNYNIKWAFYAFPIFIPENSEENIYGAKLLNQQRIRNAKIFVPPLQEQNLIVNFLDNERKKINHLIQIQQNIIELFNEKINASIMKYLDESSTKHIRLAHACDVISRPVVQNDKSLYTQLGLFNKGRGIFFKDERNSENMGDSNFFWIEKGDLILSGQFAWEGAVSIAQEEHTGCVVSHRYPVIRGKEGVALTEYLLAIFQSAHGDFILNENSRGAAGRNKPLNMALLLKEKIPIIDYASQEKIKYLIDSKKYFLEKSFNQIKLLKEYLNSVVTNVVTGKIDLKNIK